MKTTLSILFLSLALSSFSQIPDWTLSACNSDEYTMRTELARGNAVLIDFATMWSGPCNAIAPATEDLFQEFGAGNNQLMVFGFLYQDNMFNITDCHDEIDWVSTHGITYPVFTDVEDIIFEYANAFTDNGSVGFPWLMLFFPGSSEFPEDRLVYQGHDINQVNQIIQNEWIPQLGINEALANEKELVKIVDQLGRETEFKPNTPLIYVYSDGSTKKVYTIE